MLLHPVRRHRAPKAPGGVAMCGTNGTVAPERPKKVETHLWTMLETRGAYENLPSVQRTSSLAVSVSKEEPRKNITVARKGSVATHIGPEGPAAPGRPARKCETATQ